MFLNSGDVVYQKVVEGKNEKIVTNLEKIIDIPVVVVVNESTASASEIFASALKENLNVPIVGSKTFGKATIQKVKEFSDRSFVKFTVQTWLTSNGSSINDVGIIPDYEITSKAEEILKKLSELLNKKQKELNKTIFLVSDEPYRELNYIGIDYPFVTKYYDNSIVVYSFSSHMELRQIFFGSSIQ